MIVKNINVSINGKHILDNLSFSLGTGEKICLVGVNGSGKSTLLKALSGVIDIDLGVINLNGSKVSYLRQEIPHEYDEYSIIDYIKFETGIDNLEKKLRELENKLTEDNMDEYGEILNTYLSLDGYSFDNNLEIILSGLKLNKDLHAKVKTLSGGEKIKVLLSILLLKNEDVMLLDEPTNNLDSNAILWLEEYLKNSGKAMIIVSHDEVFLNNIVTKIFELDDGKINEYNMGYNDYLFQKDIEYQNQREVYEQAISDKLKLKRQLQKAKEWSSKGNNKSAHNDNDKIANNFAKERTNNKSVSKISKALDKLSVPDFEEKKPIKFFFNFDNKKGNKNIVIRDLICGYDNFSTPLINMVIEFGDRIEIMGGNGSGKSTLINTIMGRIKPISGDVVIGNDAKIGYISQDTLEVNSDDTVLEWLTKGIEDYDLSFIFTLLDKFNFSYDDRDKKYKNLSPGERTRINLAKLALNKINILILDEVTNHLDKEAIDLIYELISSFEGTIISISHNRKYNEILNPNIVLDISNGSLVYKENNHRSL